MSVLINLLPDLRLQKQKDKERRQLVGLIAGIVLAVCGVFIVLMLVITYGQSTLIKNARNDIAQKKTTLQNTKGLADAYTAQFQLTQLAGIYADRTLITKLMKVFAEASPTGLRLSTYKFDKTDGSLKIAGTVTTFAEAAKLDRALEAEHISIGTGSPSDEPYFTKVELTSTENSNGKGVDFSLTAVVMPGAIHEK